MPIFRNEYRSNFTTLPNGALNDKALSFKARGILHYLLGKPNDWKTQITDLINNSTDGEGAIRSGIKELETAGYIIKKQIRDEQGKITGYEYSVFSEPYSNYPNMDKPNVDKIPLQRTDIQNTDFKKKNDNGAKDICTHSQNKEFTDIYNYFRKYYLYRTGKEHPRLKAEQIERCELAILAFMENTIADVPIFAEMIEAYFDNVKDTDYNFNHFCTDGILQNRLYDAGYT